MKISTKLSLAMLLITIGCGVATSAIVSSYMLKSLEKERIDNVLVVVRSLSNQLAEGVINEDPVAVREILHGLLSPQRGLDFAYLVESNGNIMAHTFGGKVPVDLPRIVAKPPTKDGNQSFVRFEHRNTPYLIGYYSLLEGERLGTVHVGINLAVLYAHVRKITILIMSISLAVGVFGLLAASYAALRFTRPLKQLTDSIVAFGCGESIHPVIEEGGAEIRQLSSAFLKMVESRDRAEEALRFQRALLEAQNTIALDGILIVSPERKILYYNKRFLEIWSIPASHGAETDEALLATAHGQVGDLETFLTKVQYLYEQPDEISIDEFAFKDGRIIERYSASIADGAGNRYGRIWFFRDITERKSSEAERFDLKQQMLHVQKLESLGVLAGGIAHDFNNILMAIMGNTELALMKLNPDSPAVERLKKVMQSAQHAANLAGQMLAYSGRGKFLVSAIDLNTLIEEMKQILEVSISKKVQLDLHLNRPLPSINADATQIRQIIMNLVINASEAIGDRSGIITINSVAMECDRLYLKNIWHIDDLEAGLYVFIEVSDNGCGMDKKTQSKVFDPFFTTKFTGRGLGMAAVQGIVRSHNGGISVYSEPGTGSTFKVLLPACGKPSEQAALAEDDGAWKGEGVVLVVDDEETVREIGADMLSELGYQVITAEDGEQAVEMYRERNDISLVLLDLNMPHMDGIQCLKELRLYDPGAKVVISSGYSEQEISQKFDEEGLTGIIQKPYRISALKEVLKNISKGKNGYGGQGMPADWKGIGG